MEHKFTAKQIIEVLATTFLSDDETVRAERLKISEKYSELKRTPRWHSTEELAEKYPWALKTTPKGGELLPGFEECAIESKVWWLNENVLDPPEQSINEDCICPSCQFDPPGLCKPGCICPCHCGGPV